MSGLSFKNAIASVAAFAVALGGAIDVTPANAQGTFYLWDAD